MSDERKLSNIDNILVNGDELILNRVFDSIGFSQIADTVFRKLVQSRLSYPASKAAKEFIVVADSGFMNNDNVAELEKLDYKYIIGAKIKTESKQIQQRILAAPKKDGMMHEIIREDGRRLLVGQSV